ncbi:dienelactone hydrolase [Ottowia beijingensis]|uniref:alpha/beta hydrolase family protein n=1 Tax=Ottowia beijingensis TaxID=1207057 RepID=UPI002FDA0D58
MPTFSTRLRPRRCLLALGAWLLALTAQASTGLMVLPAPPGGGPVTLVYPSASPAQTVQRMARDFTLAQDGVPQRGNGRLVVLSHGSGGSPWPQFDLAQALVSAGFTVAMPEHAGDNWHDMSKVGPESWTLRPREVSQAIDAVAADPRLAPLQLAPQRVGLYGMSAGGIAALTLAGARWSPALWARHCDAHMRDDFAACAGLVTTLTGGLLDGAKVGLARAAIRARFAGDAEWRHWHAPRITAVVAAVPMATPIDLGSVMPPRVPLGLVRAGRDAWLAPRFHIDAVHAACASSRLPDGAPGCTLVADMPQGGHGATLSPQPIGLSPPAASLLNDPPGFDRAGTLPSVYAAIVRFFQDQLGAAPAAPASPAAR